MARTGRAFPGHPFVLHRPGGGGVVDSGAISLTGTGDISSSAYVITITSAQALNGAGDIASSGVILTIAGASTLPGTGDMTLVGAIAVALRQAPPIRLVARDAGVISLRAVDEIVSKQARDAGVISLRAVDEATVARMARDAGTVSLKAQDGVVETY